MANYADIIKIATMFVIAPILSSPEKARPE